MIEKNIQKKEIVVIGGGTGTHTILRGLKRYTETVHISAVVTMADSGGSTGRLRDEFGFLPVGDVRLALVALARNHDEYDDMLRKLFLHRFDRGDGLAGHTFGNLFLIALTQILGNEEDAIRAAAHLLGTHGEVIPVTTGNAHLRARYDDGSERVGEHVIDIGEGIASGGSIVELSLTPHVAASDRALTAVRNANLIVLGPGDLYTSILANCVVDGMAEALATSSARLVYISNLMSRRAQTNTMGTKEHVTELTRYIGRKPDVVLVNTAPFREDLIAQYEEEGEHPVLHNLADDTCEVITKDFLASENIIRERGDVIRRSLIRHDPEKLAHAIMQLI